MSRPVVHCWRSRYEALGFATATDAILGTPPEELDRLAAEHGHQDEGFCEHWFAALDDTCLEEAGHAGPCRFVPTEGIVVAFLPVVPL